MVSGTNFITSVLLARWLVPAQYGLYALMLSFVYVLASVQQALVIQPMRVFGGTIYKADQREYFGNLILGSIAIGGLVALLFGALGFAWSWFEKGETPYALAGAGLAILGVMLFWLGRNASYITSGPKAASACDALYVVITLAGLWALRVSGNVSIFSVLVLLGVCSLVTAGLLFSRLRPRFTYAGVSRFGEQWGRHWRFGKWELTSTGIGSVNRIAIYGASGALLGMTETGALRALMNLTLPAQQFVNAINRLAVPRLSETFASGGARATRKAVWRIGLLFAALGLLGWMAATVFRHEIFRLLYGGAYSEYADYLPPLMLAIVALLVSGMFEAGLRAIRAPQAITVRHTATTAVCVGFGVPATALLGFPGIVATACLYYVSAMGVTAYLFGRKTAKGATPSQGPVR